MSETPARRTASAVAVHLLLAALVAERTRAVRGGSGWGGPGSLVVAITLSVVLLAAFAGGLAAGLLL